MAGGSLMYDTGNPKLELCDNQEGWGAKVGEKGAQKGGVTGMPMADSCLCMTESNTML